MHYGKVSARPGASCSGALLPTLFIDEESVLYTSIDPPMSLALYAEQSIINIFTGSHNVNTKRVECPTEKKLPHIRKRHELHNARERIVNCCDKSPASGRQSTSASSKEHSVHVDKRLDGICFYAFECGPFEALVAKNSRVS